MKRLRWQGDVLLFYGADWLRFVKNLASCRRQEKFLASLRD